MIQTINPGMSYGEYDIENRFPNPIIVAIVTFVLSIWAAIRLYKITLKTGLVRKINKRLGDIYFISEGLLKKIKEEEITTDKAAKAHIHIEKALRRYIKLYSSFEKVNFFTNSETKKLTEDTLNNFYEAESLIRVAAFSSASVPEDKNLLFIASQLSLGSYQS